MNEEIFLSASIPIAGRGEYFDSADPLLIQAAIRAFTEVVLGRRTIVWGGHPTITPMIMAACIELGVAYGDSVILYQSMFFKDEFPEDNLFFKNVVFTEAVDGDRDASLALMRNEMLKREELYAAVFVGGMEGVEVERAIFSRCHPQAQQIYVGSTGGAAGAISRMLAATNEEMESIDYFRMFHNGLKISPAEERQLSRTRAIERYGPKF